MNACNEMRAPAGNIPGPVLFPFTGTNVGGSHISTFHLARSLASDHGIRTVVIALDDTSITREASAMGLEVFPMSGRGRHSLVLGYAARLTERRRVLAQFGAEAIVHCNDLWTLQAWGLAGRMLGLPVVYHHRMLRPMNWINRLRLRLADRVICISQACRDNVAFLPEGRATSILNPFADMASVPHGTGRDVLERVWGLQTPPVLVGFAANFQARKRPDFFIDVCRELSERVPQARFVLFGRNRDFTIEQLGALAKERGIRDKVFFAGFRSPPELNLAPLDVLAAPATAEPFGRTLIESLMVGTPYVATDDAGHSEIFSRWGGGKVVKAEASAEQFAAEIANVIAHPEEVQIPPARLKEIVEELSPLRHAGNVCGVYSGMRKQRGYTAQMAQA